MQYDDTRIYRTSLELVSLSRDVIADLPAGYGFIADQLRRASASVVLNFAEGYGKGSLAEQRRFFRIARGSACEVAAVLDVAACFGVVSATHCGRGRELCDHLARMLSRFRAVRRAA